MLHRLLIGGLIAALATLGLPESPRAESILRLESPERFGEVPAATYDLEGRRVGDAHLEMERSPDGTVAIEARSGIDGAERTAARAVLESIGAQGRLRLLSQESRSFDSLGRPLGRLSIDHVRAEAECEAPEGDSVAPARIRLPEQDRIANVPLNLLFLPLARKEVSQVDFQILICRGGPRLLDAEARVAEHASREGGRHIVEVRYRLELGPVLSQLIQPFVPRLSFWFDGDASGAWIAHRMPLYSKGPTVLVVRTGVSPGLLEGAP